MSNSAPDIQASLENADEIAELTGRDKGDIIADLLDDGKLNNSNAIKENTSALDKATEMAGKTQPLLVQTTHFGKATQIILNPTMKSIGVVWTHQQITMRIGLMRMMVLVTTKLKGVLMMRLLTMTLMLHTMMALVIL